MSRNKITLTKGQLHRVVAESVRRIISEGIPVASENEYGIPDENPYDEKLSEPVAAANPDHDAVESEIANDMDYISKLGYNVDAI